MATSPKSTEIFRKWAQLFSTPAAKELNKNFTSVVAFQIKDVCTKTMDFRTDQPRLIDGDGQAQGIEKADVTLIMSDDDFSLMSDGKLDSRTAFMKGKLKIKGNMGVAMKFGSVMETARNKIKEQQPRSRL